LNSFFFLLEKDYNFVRVFLLIFDTEGSSRHWPDQRSVAQWCFVWVEDVRSKSEWFIESKTCTSGISSWRWDGFSRTMTSQPAKVRACALDIPAMLPPTITAFGFLPSLSICSSFTWLLQTYGHISHILYIGSMINFN